MSVNLVNPDGSLTVVPGTETGGKNFVGTLEQWNALTDAQKAQYDTYDITDEFNGIPVDSALSGTSTNPVQNKVVKQALDAKQTKNSETQIGTLSIGSTSITLTFTEETIGTDTLVDIYADAYGVNPTAVATTSSTVTLTFDAQESALKVGVRITN